jgi:hypothetical protein
MLERRLLKAANPLADVRFVQVMATTTCDLTSCRQTATGMLRGAAQQSDHAMEPSLSREQHDPQANTIPGTALAMGWKVPTKVERGSTPQVCVVKIDQKQRQEQGKCLPFADPERGETASSGLEAMVPVVLGFRWSRRKRGEQGNEIKKK